MTTPLTNSARTRKKITGCDAERQLSGHKPGQSGAINRMIRVYIASPYSQGDIARNVKRSMDAANELMDLGYAPFCPLLSHFLHINHPRPYESWVEQDNAWVTVCDAVLRLSGESKGADAEVRLAEKHGIPVFNCITALCIGRKAIRRE